ncbi:hypothetical protein E4T42_07664 [Aureobasidium subglaciale]|nr:hypothetical protein E4T42_07664 [Aureobasidium subglaciale]
MKFSHVIISALSIGSAVNAAVIPEEANSLSIRSSYDIATSPESSNTLEKRKGGGGGGRGGGGSSSGGRSGSSSSSGSSGSSGRSGSSSSSGSSGSRGSSGVSPSYGGGRYYAGGSTSAYRSGGRSPGGIAPYALGGAALGIGVFALYGAGAYAYPYAHPYYFHNRTEAAQNQTYTDSMNTTLPVQCVCEPNADCGCDDQEDNSYIDSIVGNGSVSDINSTLARVANINGTETLVLNGTLAEGTASTSAANIMRPESAGMWLLAAGVGAFVYVL